jgi:hypothetical protein
MSEQVDLQGIWKQVSDRIHREIIHRGLWDATENALPLVLDGDILVVGLKPPQMNLASYLSTQQHRAQIEQILLSILGRKVMLRAIEGQDAGAWDRTKEREQAQVDSVLDSAEYRAANRGALEAYETVNTAVHRLYVDGGARRFPEKMAKLLIKAIPMIADAEDAARAAVPDNEDLHFSHLNKILERLGTFCDLPPTVAALEYLRYRSAKRRQ